MISASQVLHSLTIVDVRSVDIEMPGSVHISYLLMFNVVIGCDISALIPCFFLASLKCIIKHSRGLLAERFYRTPVNF